MLADLALLTLIGTASGLIAGLVGLAGGIIVVPALTWVYGMPALHAAIVTSWFAVLVNSISAASRQWACRNVVERAELLRDARWYLLGGALISPAIAITSSQHQEWVTPSVVAILQLLVLGPMLWPVPDVERARRDKPARDAGAGAMVAALSTAIGVGGGTYTIAYLVYGGGVRFRDAIATANLMGVVIGLLSVGGFLATLGWAPFDATRTFGPISPVGIAAVVVSGAIAAPVGVRISHLLPTRTLRYILIVALAVSAVRMLLA